LATVARARSVGVVRTVMMSCLELSQGLQDVSPVAEVAVAQVIGVVRAALAPQTNGPTGAAPEADTDASPRTPGGPPGPAAASTASDTPNTDGKAAPGTPVAPAPGEAVLIPANGVVALSQTGIGSAGPGKFVTGPVAPHVDLSKAGWSIGWRM
jgi:hypothetical protein